jgi:hypothetical protein
VYDGIRSKVEFYAMLENELDDWERIDRGESIEYTETELREKMDILDKFMSELKENPSIGEEIVKNLKSDYDTNEC